MRHAGEAASPLVMLESCTNLLLATGLATVGCWPLGAAQTGLTGW